MSALTTGAANRASAARHQDVARGWRRRARVRSVMFLDPDMDTGNPLLGGLRAMGIEVSVQADAFWALLDVGQHRPDVMVISARTPVGDAVRTVSILRAEFALPILLAVTADETDAAAPVIVAGARPVLDLPYRIEAVLAALQELEPSRSRVEPMQVGDLALDPASMDGRFRGRHLDLSPKEFAVLWALAERAGDVVPQDELRRVVWPGRDVTAATLATTIARVRHDLAAVGACDVIRTIRRLGYRLETDRLRAIA